MLIKVRIFTIGIALIGAFTLATGNLLAQPPSPGSGWGYFAMPIKITGTLIIQGEDTLSGKDQSVENFITKTVKINNAWFINDLWSSALGNEGSPPSATSIYYDGNSVTLCTGKGESFDCYADVTQYLSIYITANTNGTWKGKSSPDTGAESASGTYLAAISFNDGAGYNFYAQGLYSEKYSQSCNARTGACTLADSMKLSAVGEGTDPSGKSATVTITVSGGGKALISVAQGKVE